jgi:hypothetical protein
VEQNVIQEQVPIYKRQGLKTAAIIIGTLLIAYGMANLEVIRRARAAYNRGEAKFAEKKYKEAMWDYQEVQEFYMLPHTKWVDQAAEKEWICRAYLGDFVPPEGPMDADVRTLEKRNGQPNDYPKYKDVIAQITPVGDTSYQPAPLTTYEKDMKKKGAKIIEPQPAKK